jgi:hypothetical protein
VRRLVRGSKEGSEVRRVVRRFEGRCGTVRRLVRRFGVPQRDGRFGAARYLRSDRIAAIARLISVSSESNSSPDR